jgi:16S rRNA (cytidine1402-2'-O)-methyltransferase
VLFESGGRLAACLADLASTLGPRPAAVCRELTKLHEEIRRDDLSNLAQIYAKGGETRGEIVIVIAPPADDDSPAEDLDDMLRRALTRVSVKDAVGEVALATGRPRREVYRRALELAEAAGNTDDDDGAR